MGKTKRKSIPITPQALDSLAAPLQALQNLLGQFDQHGVIVGGIAASFLGTPRYTVDLDAVFLLSIEDLPKFLEMAAQQGIEPRIADAIAFARQSRVLLLKHVASGTAIDISLGMLPFEVEMIERSQMFDLGGIQLRLPTSEDLIIMKAVARRPKDLEDIRAIVAKQPFLDKKRIRFWLEQFGEALDWPELWREIEKLLLMI